MTILYSAVSCCAGGLTVVNVLRLHSAKDSPFSITSVSHYIYYCKLCYTIKKEDNRGDSSRDAIPCEDELSVIVGNAAFTVQIHRTAIPSLWRRHVNS